MEHATPRRRRFLICSILIPLAVVGLSLIYLRPHSRSVIWKGEPAQYWIGRLNYFDLEASSSSAEEFLFAAGPAVVPELIRGLSTHDSWLADWLFDLYFKLGKWQRFFRLPTKPAYYRQNCAMGLGLLGPAASNAAPALLRVLKDPDPYVRSKAAEALGRIGADRPRVVTELAAGLSSTNSNDRLGCVIGLCHCLPGSPEAAAALRKALRDPDPNTRFWAAESLWRDDSNREATYLALVDALEGKSSAVRFRAAESLGKLAYNPGGAAEALGAALEREQGRGPDQITVWKLVASLGELGPAARPTVPLLINQSTRTNDTLAAILSLCALHRIEPDNQDWIDQLTRRLKYGNSDDAFWAAQELGRCGKTAQGAIEPLRQMAETASDWRTKAMAATAAWRIDPSSPNPINLITNHLSQSEPGQHEIVRLLGELGFAARPALPTLLNLRFGRGIMMHDDANEALQRVAPEYLADPWKK